MEHCAAAVLSEGDPGARASLAGAAATVGWCVQKLAFARLACQTAPASPAGAAAVSRESGRVSTRGFTERTIHPGHVSGACSCGQSLTSSAECCIRCGSTGVPVASVQSWLLGEGLRCSCKRGRRLTLPSKLGQPSGATVQLQYFRKEIPGAGLVSRELTQLSAGWCSSLL